MHADKKNRTKNVNDQKWKRTYVFCQNRSTAWKYLETADLDTKRWKLWLRQTSVWSPSSPTLKLVITKQTLIVVFQIYMTGCRAAASTRAKPIISLKVSDRWSMDWVKDASLVLMGGLRLTSVKEALIYSDQLWNHQGTAGRTGELFMTVPSTLTDGSRMVLKSLTMCKEFLTTPVLSRFMPSAPETSSASLGVP